MGYDLLFLQPPLLFLGLINLPTPSTLDFDHIRSSPIPLPHSRRESKCNTQSIFLCFFQSPYLLAFLGRCNGWVVVGFISGIPVDIFMFLPSTLGGVYCGSEIVV